MAGTALSIGEAALQLFFQADNLTEDKLRAVAKDVTTLFHNFHVESLRVRNFKMDVKWKTRVISIPQAINNIREIFDGIREIVEDKGKTLVQPFEDFITLLNSFKDFEAGAAAYGGRAPSRLATGFSVLEQFIQALNGLVGDVDEAIKEVSNMGALFDRILNDLESMDDLFLSQSSPREKKTVTYFKRNA